MALAALLDAAEAVVRRTGPAALCVLPGGLVAELDGPLGPAARDAVAAHGADACVVICPDLWRGPTGESPRAAPIVLLAAFAADGATASRWAEVRGDALGPFRHAPLAAGRLGTCVRAGFARG